MARTKFRSRARARSAPRRAGLSRTSTTAVSSRSGDSWAKYILPAAAVGIVAYLLWPKRAEAAVKGVDKEKGIEPKPPNPNPNPNPQPVRRFPAGANLATVQSPGPFPAGTAPGMRLRASASPTATMVHAGIPNGTQVQLLRKDIAQEGAPDTPGKNRWAEVITLEGVQGFLRAIGPEGESNIVIQGVGTDPSTQGFAPTTGAFAAFHPQQLRLHQPHPHPVRRKAPPGWRGW